MISNKYSRICFRAILLAGFLLLFALLFSYSVIYRGRYHPQWTATDECLQNRKPFFHRKYVPKHVHQLFFFAGDSVIPSNLKNAQESWSVTNPTFKYKLWDPVMVEDLILKNFPEELVDLYHSYDHWVSKTDFARLAILYMYGGIYADIDMENKKSMMDFYTTVLEGARFAVFQTKPSGLSNSFIVSSPGHPFVRHLLCGLPAAKRNYVIPYITILMTAGPEYFNSALATYSLPHDDIKLIDGDIMKDYVRDFHSGSWHSWDGKIIWWFYSNFIIHGNLWKLFLLILMTTAAVFIISKYRKQDGSRT